MSDKPQRIGNADYRSVFGDGRDADARAETLSHALDIRKFEIELYWARAAYFWTFITVALAGLGAVQTLDLNTPRRTDLGVFVCCLGLFVSFAWYFANRGSKQWQENWENHVDLLEDGVVGPLYKIVIRRPRPRWYAWPIFLLTGPGPYSVSKINQIISVYIILAWAFLLVYVLPAGALPSSLTVAQAIAIDSTLVSVAILGIFGRTHQGNHANVATVRSSSIADPTEA